MHQRLQGERSKKKTNSKEATQNANRGLCPELNFVGIKGATGLKLCSTGRSSQPCWIRLSFNKWRNFIPHCDGNAMFVFPVPIINIDLYILGYGFWKSAMSSQRSAESFHKERMLIKMKWKGKWLRFNRAFPYTQRRTERGGGENKKDTKLRISPSRSGTLVKVATHILEDCWKAVDV